MQINQKPFIGIVAFLIVLFTMPLGHALMVLVEKTLGHYYQFHGAAAVGGLGAVLLWLGARSDKESAGTWYGLFAGLLLWTGWVEFSFVWTAHHLNIAPLRENGEIVTKPEYLLMPSSIGLLLASLLYFVFNSQTRCNFFAWLQRNFRLNIQIKAGSAQNRNFAIITALEIIYIMWFFYIVLLLVYDNRILGDHHPATYLVFVGSLAWSLYLMLKLIRFTRMPAAIRYAVPTVVIFWNSIEILGRWNFFKEIWIEPHEYALEMSLILIAFIGATVYTIFGPKETVK